MTIKANQLPDILAAFYKTRRAAYFRGAPGIGKTDFVHAAAAQIGRAYGEHVAVVEFHLASISEVDLRGYLIPAGDEATFTKPAFWKQVQASPRGILFLDEFPQASHEVQKAAAPLLLAGRIGEYQLPPGWIVVAAGNRTDDMAGANSMLSHVLNRVCVIDVEAPEVDDWVIWAANEGLPHEVIAFAKLRPNVVFGSKVPAEEDRPFCTPRSLHALADVANAWDGGLGAMVTRESHGGIDVINGFIGEGAGAELVGVIRTAINLPSFEEAMAQPMKCRVPEEASEAYAMAIMVAVRAKHDEHPEAPIEYLTRFNVNQSLVAMLALFNRDARYMASKAFGVWFHANRDSLAKYSKYLKLR